VFELLEVKKKLLKSLFELFN